MNKVIAALTLTLISTLGSRALACAPSAQGFDHPTMSAILLQTEAKIREVNADQYTSIGLINWASISAVSGSEGDCDAKTLRATINVQAQKNGELCVLNANVVYIQSAMEPVPYFEQSNEYEDCY